MRKLKIENGKGITDVGEYCVEVNVQNLEEEGSFCIHLELLGIDNCWYGKASVHPGSIHELIEALQITAATFELEKPETSLFVYKGEPGRA